MLVLAHVLTRWFDLWGSGAIGSLPTGPGNAKGDIKMQTKQPYFEVYIQGQYAARGENRTKVARNYKTKVRIPESSINMAQSLIQGVFLPTYLLSKDPDYAHVRTCFILDAIPKDSASKTNMTVDELLVIASYDELKMLVNKLDLPINVELFPTTQGLRDAVRMAKDNPEVFTERQNRKKKVPATEYQKFLEMNEMTVKDVIKNPIVNVEDKASSDEEGGALTNIEDLQKEAEELGLKYQKNWKAETLLRKIEEYKAAVGGRDTAAGRSPLIDEV